jgi:hypothetical protein
VALAGRRESKKPDKPRPIATAMLPIKPAQKRGLYSLAAVVVFFGASGNISKKIHLHHFYQ